MSVVTAIGRFLYDLLVGDSWPLTLVTVLVLCAGVAAAEFLAAPPAGLAIAMAVAAAATASLTVLIEARRALRAR